MISLEDYGSISENAYLLRSPKNAKRLMSATEELESGGGTERGITGLLYLSDPFTDRFFPGMRAVTKEHIDQILIGNAAFLSKSLKIINGFLFDTDGDLLFQHTGVRIFFGF